MIGSWILTCWCIQTDTPPVNSRLRELEDSRKEERKAALQQRQSQWKNMEERMRREEEERRVREQQREERRRRAAEERRNKGWTVVCSLSLASFKSGDILIGPWVKFE